ncbi:hypothetical protein CEP53_007416 [Fusarium sp. AF-6]|nr:hypothetical protein CEP53_007416 [Fusarium sp. AF-6]
MKGREWEIDHQDWEYRREEALDDFVKSHVHSLYLDPATRCEQPGYSSSLWMRYYNMFFMPLKMVWKLQ